MKPSARSISSAIYTEESQRAPFRKLTVVVSRGPSAASTCGAPIKPAAPAATMPPIKPRRVWIRTIATFLSSRLQLAFELVQEAPVRAVGDDLLGRRLDHPGLMHPKSIEADRVLGVVFPPFVIGDRTQCLEGIIVPRGEAAIDELAILTATVKVNVTDPGATVAVDGNTVGTTPLASPVRVNIGEHTVTVTKEVFTAGVVNAVGP